MSSTDVSSTDWDPAQYERFAAERAQPFWDLVDLIHRGGIERAVDLGCGTGALTVSAAERLGIGQMTGIDNSPAMLEVAATHGRVEVDFQYGDISRWTSNGDYDLVLANAALQWVPDHRAVLERWVAALAPDGQLALQVPANHDHPSHLASAFVATQEPFASALGGEPPPDPVVANVLSPEAYADRPLRVGSCRTARAVAGVPPRVRVVDRRGRVDARHVPDPVLQASPGRHA